MKFTIMYRNPLGTSFAEVEAETGQRAVERFLEGKDELLYDVMAYGPTEGFFDGDLWPEEGLKKPKGLLEKIRDFLG